MFTSAFHKTQKKSWTSRKKRSQNKWRYHQDKWNWDSFVTKKNHRVAYWKIPCSRDYRMHRRSRSGKILPFKNWFVSTGMAHFIFKPCEMLKMKTGNRARARSNPEISDCREFWNFMEIKTVIKSTLLKKLESCLLCQNIWTSRKVNNISWRHKVKLWFFWRQKNFSWFMTGHFPEQLSSSACTSGNIWLVILYLTLNLEIYSIERDDRLILLNGHKIRTKEKLIEKLAQDTDQLTLTVVDKETETIFDQHNIDITEELGKFWILVWHEYHDRLDWKNRCHLKILFRPLIFVLVRSRFGPTRSRHFSTRTWLWWQFVNQSWHSGTANVL